jgi:hypothetical protein
VPPLHIGGWSAFIRTLSSLHAELELGRYELSTDERRLLERSGVLPVAPAGAGAGSTMPSPAFVGPSMWEEDIGRCVTLQGPGVVDPGAGREVVEVRLCGDGKVTLSAAYSVSAGTEVVFSSGELPGREWTLAAEVLCRLHRFLLGAYPGAALFAVCPGPCVSPMSVMMEPRGVSLCLSLRAH